MFSFFADVDQPDGGGEQTAPAKGSAGGGVTAGRGAAAKGGAATVGTAGGAKAEPTVDKVVCKVDDMKDGE